MKTWTVLCFATALLASAMSAPYAVAQEKSKLAEAEKEVVPVAVATPVPVSELKSLAGIWRGTQTDRWGAGQVEWTIENGRFKAVVTNQLRGTYRAEGYLFLTKGQVVWRGGGSTGTVTLYELSGRQMIKLDGLGSKSNRPISGELYKVE